MIKRYVGSNWKNEDDTNRETLINLLGLTAQTYMVSLAANRPRVLVSTQTRELLPFARQFQVGINNLLKEIQFERTLRQVVMDAFFSVGIVKIYWGNAGAVEMPNPEMPAEPGMFATPAEWGMYRQIQQAIAPTILVDPGKPMVERISLDDYGFDTMATSLDKCRFQWHEYRLPLSVVQKDDRFDESVVQKLRGTSKWSDDRYDGRDTKASELTQEQDCDYDEVEPYVTLRDIYLPFENMWAVTAVGTGDMKPLLYETWDGPERGPFRHLGFDHVPDNIMPISPAANLKGLHCLVNALMRKQARQARRQKDITTYMGNEGDARRVRDAQDGEMVSVMNPEMIQVRKYGGVDQLNLAFHQVVDGIYSRMAGNLDAMAGLGPQSGTAKQDELIHGAVSRREAHMQYSVVEFVGDIAHDLGWMLWVDKAKELPGEINEPGLLLPIKADWTPDEREGDFAQYGLEVEPYSMAYQSPQQRVGQINQAIQAVAPFLGTGMVTINVPALVDTYAELLNIPRLREILTVQDPALAAGMQQQGGGVPNNGPREYVRRNVSTQGSPDSQRTTMAQQLISGANSQPQQAG
jgi:hypothetical protein